MLLAARGDADGAECAFARSVAIHDTLPTRRPFELGRTLLALGRLQRQRHRKAAARETLRRSIALLDETGARLWVAKAEAELARIGGRPAATRGLSEVEARIVDHVVAGETNKEIGGALGISPKTVAWNLSRTYAKLGVTSRTELVVKVADVARTPVTRS